MPHLTATVIAHGLQAQQIPAVRVRQANKETNGQVIVSDRVEVEISLINGARVSTRMLNDMAVYSGRVDTIKDIFGTIREAVKQVPMSVEDRIRWHLFKHYKRKHVLVVHNYVKFLEGLVAIATDQEADEMDRFVELTGNPDAHVTLPNPDGTDQKTFLIFDLRDPLKVANECRRYEERFDAPDASAWSQAELIYSTVSRHPRRQHGCS